MTTRFSRRNDAGPHSSNTAAISLWQKFSLLQQSIEECIKARKEIDAKIDASQTRQSDLRELRRENLHESREAERKLNDIEAEMAALQNHYDEEIQPSYASALLEKRSIEIKLSQWKEYKASALQLFLDRSAKFRLDCKRFQMASEALGLRHSQSQSWMYVISCERGEDTACAALDDFNERIHHICPADDDVGAKRDNPLLWNIPQKDFELLELAETYKRNLHLYEDFRKDLDVLKSRKTECLQHEQTLTERATLMQKQLNRISNDCNDLESQMANQCAATLCLAQPPFISGYSTEQYQELPEEQHTKRARSNPYFQSKTNRSSNSASKRKKALQSVVLGSTAVDPPTVSSPFRSDSTTKRCESSSRFQHYQFVSESDEVHCQKNPSDANQSKNKDRDASSSGATGGASEAIDDDDDDEDGLFSFIGLRK